MSKSCPGERDRFPRGFDPVVAWPRVNVDRCALPGAYPRLDAWVRWRLGEGLCNSRMAEKKTLTRSRKDAKKTLHFTEGVRSIPLGIQLLTLLGRSL